MSSLSLRFSPWSLIGIILAVVFFAKGCGGGGGGAAPVGPALVANPVWSTSLNEVQQALQSAGETGWTAGETGITREFGQTEAGTLCGMLPDPLLSSFSTSLREHPESLATGPNANIRVQELPRRFSWRDRDGQNWTTPVKTQGKFGTCVAFAAVTALEIGQKIAAGTPTSVVDYSEWHLWHEGTKGKNPNPGGWYVSGAANYLQKSGIVSEEACPYVTIPVFPNLAETLPRATITNWSAVSGRTSLKMALQKGPVVTSMRVLLDFFYYQGGVYTPRVGPEYGDHAIVLIGFDDDAGCWIAQNSWSNAWGEDGFFRIKYGAIGDIGLTFNVSATPKTPDSTGLSDPTKATGTTTATGATGETLAGALPEPLSGAGSSLFNLGPYIKEVSANAAIVCWATNEDATARVEYGTPEALSRVTEQNALAGTHSVRLSGLQESTGYRFRVSSQNAAGISASSEVQSFVTPSAAISAAVTTSGVTPIIFDVNATKITKDSAVILWKTDRPSTSRVFYSLNGIGTFSTDLRMLTVHSITLKNLSGNTKYAYYVESTIDPNTARSDPEQFTTLDAVPPTISSISAILVTGTSASIVWYTNKPSSSQVDYGWTDAYGWSTPLNNSYTQGHLVRLTGLIPNSTYHFRVKSRDITNNEGVSGNNTVPTLDTVPPVIADVFAVSTTGTTATITFATNKTTSSLVEYGIGIYNNQTFPVATQTAFTIVLTGLTPRQGYKYRIRAKDALGNEAVSKEMAFTTPDTIFPIISELKVNDITNTSATIFWRTDKSSTSQVEWGYTAGAYFATSALDLALTRIHSVKLSSLPDNPTGVWHFRVWSKDSVGNMSFSTDQTFSLPLTISNITMPYIGPFTASVSWETLSPSTSIVEYGLTPIYGSQAQMFPYPSEYVQSHTVNLIGLTPFTTYNFRVRSKDKSGQEVASPNRIFQTIDSGAPLISRVSAQNVSGGNVIVTWATDKNTSRMVEYGTSPGVYTANAVANVPWSISHSVTLVGLFQGKTYYYRVKSTDAAGLTAVSAEQSFVTPGVASPLISALQVASLTDSIAIITWTTDQPATTQLEYGLTTMATTMSPILLTATTTHSVTLANLSPYTTYYFRARSRNTAGLETTSPPSSFKTVDLKAPVISEVTAQNITGTSATIAWKTDENSDTLVEYGLTTAYGSFSTINPTMTKNHLATLISLAENSTYSFRVISKDQFNHVASAVGTFTTLDRTAPVISGIDITGSTTTTVTITWSTNEPATTQVEYGLTNGYGMTQPVFPAPSTLTSGARTVVLTGLTPGTTYHFRVRSVDATGNPAVSKNYLCSTVDAVAPVISGVVAQNITGNAATIVWKTDEAADSSVSYGSGVAYAYTLNSAKAAFEKDHAVTLTGLTEGTVYHFQVTSKDPTNNTASTIDYTFTTLDATAPVFTVVPAAASILENGFTVTWNTNERATSRLEYGLTTTYGTIAQIADATTQNHSISVSGLNPFTTYHYRVRSKDAAGNELISGDYTVKTLSTLVIQNILVASQTWTPASLPWTKAQITWTTNAGSACEIRFGPAVTVVNGPQVEDSALWGTTHSVWITMSDGTSGNPYYFQITATSGGVTVNSPVQSFLHP
jgi:phosphodiesterase/alkaline phosphatase D-like protein